MNSFGLDDTPARKRDEEIQRSFRDRKFRVFLVTSSDPETDNMLLLRAKCLFQKQLSKMPKEYIFRQVFDSKHINMLLVNEDGTVAGGICYRPFFEQSFVEVVFLAVDYDFQVKGMGGFMMDLFKENIKMDARGYEGLADDVLGIFRYKNRIIEDLDCFPDGMVNGMPHPLYIMAYADNFAIGYFKKQGFSSEIRFDKWVGLIKDYEGGTIVECRVYWEINYLKKKEFIGKIKNKLLEDMKTVNEYHVIRGISDYSKIRKVTDIPGVFDAEYPAQNSTGSLYRLILYLISDLRGNASAWPFLKPVDPLEVPDYHRYIVKPMDLSTMLSKLEKGEYKFIEPFVEDVKLMLSNCFEYNGKDTPYYKCAQILQGYFDDKLKFYGHVIARFSTPQ